MTLWDWGVVALYMAGMVFMGWRLGRGQRGHGDYFLAGRAMRPGVVALSIMATQASAVSLIGAPAFIALAPHGGLRWLQYELALPAAMALIGAFLLPPLFRSGALTVYEFIGRRLGPGSRSALAAVFLLSRFLAASVALYAASVVLSACLRTPLFPTLALMGIVTLAYTTMGGIRADIYSDVVQFILLAGAAAVAVGVLVWRTGVWFPTAAMVDSARMRTLIPEVPLFREAGAYGLWPMLLGGLLLYVSYYGCDQSQAQRLLTLPTLSESRRALVYNGLFRFPFVLLYCWMGLLLAAYLAMNPSFAAGIPADRPDYLVPLFLLDHFPPVLTGLVVAGIFAASMSSLDSAYNSLSAVVQGDVLRRPSGRITLRSSRAWTLAWGALSIGAAALFSHSRATVIELVNMIGSVFYGPILGLFILALIPGGFPGVAAVFGLAAGTALNLALWKGLPSLSWFWWNAAGFIGCLTAAWGARLFFRRPFTDASGEEPPARAESFAGSAWMLVGYGVLMTAALAWLGVWLAGR